MKLYEYQAKDLFRAAGIPVPEGAVVRSDAEVDGLSLGYPVMAKSQLLAGKRGKAGLIRKCADAKALKAAVAEWIGKKHQGETISSVLVEKCLDIAREIYLSVTPDPTLGCPIVIASGEGGMDIEELAAEKPDAIVREPVNIFRGVRPYQSRWVTTKLGLSGDAAKQAASIVSAIYNLYRKNDAELVEINPLVVDRDGKVWAADGKFRIDDNALPRQKQFVKGREQFETDIEYEAQQYGLLYVDLGGNIGVMCAGAGLTMTTMDLIHYNGGHPANFLEFGGAAYRQAEAALRLTIRNPRVKVIVVTVFGLIARADVIAEGLVKAIEIVKPQVPIITAVRGTGEERAREVIKAAGIEFYEETEAAIKRAVEIAKG